MKARLSSFRFYFILPPSSLHFRRVGTKLTANDNPTAAFARRRHEMADEKNQNKCARETCGCPAAKDSRYCSEECEDAAKVHMMEIGCTCHHPDCK